MKRRTDKETGYFPRKRERLLSLLIFFAGWLIQGNLPIQAQEYTRGPGNYPGRESENFAPLMVPNPAPYYNLSLHKPAYHSSSYDYNLTAQLITDGIRESKLPVWIAVTTSQDGLIPKNFREKIIDHSLVSALDVKSPGAWVQLQLGGGDKAPEIDKIKVSTRVRLNNNKDLSWKITVNGSNDGKTWQALGTSTGTDFKPGSGIFNWTKGLTTSVSFKSPSTFRYYRVNFDATAVNVWSVAEVSFSDKNKPVEVGGSFHFNSSWMSAGNGTEWVYVDLGTVCRFDRLQLFWLKRPSEGTVQVSDDAANWKDVAEIPAKGGVVDEVKVPPTTIARYVRLLMKQIAQGDHYVLTEMEVYGSGGMEPKAKPEPSVKPDGRLDLTGGNWRIQRESLVEGTGEKISKPGYSDRDWIIATVPGTALVSYWNAGALPNPNYGDNQLYISESFFNSNFWYRDEFVAPAEKPGRQIWLNFDGIDWKAEVYLNGRKLGNIEGAFIRGRFNVTGILLPGRTNVLAVRIISNATPGSVKEKTFQSPDLNGGALGADNPTFHATIGWDWIPTMRGRDIGIWNDVFISNSGSVTLENPYVTSRLPLPDTSRASIHMEVTLNNHESKPLSGTLSGKFGEVSFEKKVTLKPSASQTVVIDSSDAAGLLMNNPRLWWPNGYGQPYLYPVEMKFTVDGQQVSDEKSFLAGIRQMTYSEAGGALRIWVNGKRFTGRGGNWGFPESNLLYREREYDIAVKYHRDMNFTMIRNWVGQTGDDEFFEACDRYGIMIWQDFWLANPWDGPDPDNNSMFMANAKDFILRTRNHPSLGLYCGRNEGNPPEVLEKGLENLTSILNPGVHYTPNSAEGVVSGGGPYRAMPVDFYFKNRATPKFHSELGMPNIMTYESVKETMPDSALWPLGRMYGLHDFCLNGAQGGASFIDQIDKSFGKFDNAKDWTAMAQWLNYEGYRAMFEAQSKNRMGMLLWMSHPCWPSFVWQTYDYYFDPTGAYFGCKKGSEPLHIQWNAYTDSIEVVNYSGREADGLTAKAEIFNLDGALIWQSSVPVNSREDSYLACMGKIRPDKLTPVYFLRLKLMKGSDLVSENFYWRSMNGTDYQALRELPKVKLQAKTTVERQNDRWYLVSDITNVSDKPALMVRLKVVREKSGDRILPVIYSDNYISLMPGEKRTVKMEVENEDTRGEKPAVALEGFNLGEVMN